LSYESGDEPLPYGKRFGLTGKISYHFGNSISLPLSFLQENISFCYVYDTEKLGDYDSEWGNGYELSFFNTFSCAGENFMTSKDISKGILLVLV